MKLSAIILALVLWLGAMAVDAATLSKVLSDHAKALGGRDRLASVKSTYTEATVETGGMTGRSVSYFKAPDKSRVDFSLPLMSYSMVCDGDDCWMTDNQGLTHRLQAELGASLHSQTILERWLYLDPGSIAGKIDLVGEDADVNGTACYEISILPDDGVPITLFIDKQKYLPLAVTMVTDLAVIKSSYSDFREVDGILFPFKGIEQTEAGLVASRLSVDSIAVNCEIPDSIFQRPVDRNSQGSGSDRVDSTVVPFEFYENHLFIKVVVDGSGPFNFIFDTGAGGVAIDSRLPQILHLTRVGSQEARGVGGADSAGLYRVDRLSIGSTDLDTILAFSVDLSALQEVSGRRIDGAIGYELLSRYIVRVDYENSELEIFDKSTPPRSDWGRRCDLTVDFRLPYIDCIVDDSIPGRFRLDTGSRSGVDLNSPFVREHELLDTLTAPFATTRLVGLGGVLTSHVSPLPSLELCGARFDSLFASFATTASGLFAGRSTAGNIGSGVLQGFAVTFDYGNGAVYFNKSETFDRIARVRNMAGLLFVKENDSMTVAEVFPDGPSAQVLEKGDVLLEVNGESAVDSDVDDINWMLIGMEGKSVDIEIVRKGDRLRRKVTLRHFY